MPDFTENTRTQIDLLAKTPLRESDISRMESIIDIGDFIESSLPGAEVVSDRLITFLKLRGHVGASFRDVYSALNVLGDEDLQEIFNLAVQNGMPNLPK